MPEEFRQALSPAENGVYITLHVQPGAKREGVTGLFGTALKIALNAPPVEGKANAALLRFLAGKLGVHRNSIELCSGASSRNKRVFVPGVTIEQVIERLS